MSDLPALIFLCLSAGRTRCITDFPSATIETQESSFAFTWTKNAFSLIGGGGSSDTAEAAARLGSAVWDTAADAGAVGFVTGVEAAGCAGAFAVSDLEGVIDCDVGGFA